jgi:Asp-tRNA(Asn)/Glu-tRNA(Gln) amidotransferase A subunit family amidase
MSTGALPIGEQMPKLAQATLEDLSTGLDARRFTSYQLVQTYKRQIAEVNNDFNVVLENESRSRKDGKTIGRRTIVRTHSWVRAPTSSDI